MGIMILPYIVSVSEDAMRAVPATLREGAYALGFTKLQTALRVIIPGAFSGVTAAYILGMSRAVGETMVVAIAAGQQAKLAWNPLEGAATITAYIVQMCARRSAARLARLSHDLRGRPHALSDDAGVQHRGVLAAAQIPGGLLMTDHAPARVAKRRCREIDDQDA